MITSMTRAVAVGCKDILSTLTTMVKIIATWCQDTIRKQLVTTPWVVTWRVPKEKLANRGNYQNKTNVSFIESIWFFVELTPTPPKPPPPFAAAAIIGTGTSGHYLITNTTPTPTTQPTTNPIMVQLPNRDKIVFTHTMALPLPDLPSSTGQAHIFSNLANYSANYMTTDVKLCLLLTKWSSVKLESWQHPLDCQPHSIHEQTLCKSTHCHLPRLSNFSMHLFSAQQLQCFLMQSPRTNSLHVVDSPQRLFDNTYLNLLLWSRAILINNGKTHTAPTHTPPRRL